MLTNKLQTSWQIDRYSVCPAVRGTVVVMKYYGILHGQSWNVQYHKSFSSVLNDPSGYTPKVTQNYIYGTLLWQRKPCKGWFSCWLRKQLFADESSCMWRHVTGKQFSNLNWAKHYNPCQEDMKNKFAAKLSNIMEENPNTSKHVSFIPSVKPISLRFCWESNYLLKQRLRQGPDAIRCLHTALHTQGFIFSIKLVINLCSFNQ